MRVGAPDGSVEARKGYKGLRESIKGNKHMHSVDEEVMHDTYVAFIYPFFLFEAHKQPMHYNRLHLQYNKISIKRSEAKFQQVPREPQTSQLNCAPSH